MESRAQLTFLELKRIRLFILKEEHWRLKSRDLWLQEADENSKFFQQYARGRKSINIIWELQDQDGRNENTFVQLADIGVRHFSKIYKDPIGITLPEII